mgnify:CR=1 FL=1
MKLSIFKFGGFILIFMLLTLCFGLNFSFAKVNNKGIVVNTLNLKENNKRIEFDFKYPEVKMGNEHVQNKINILIKGDIYEFKKYIEDIYNESINIYPEEIVKTSPSFNYKGMSTFEYEIVDNILSLRVTLIQFTGGAHPMAFVKNYNFDLNTGEVLKIEDIFNEEGKKNYKEVIDKIILDKMNESPENYFIDDFKGIGDNVQYYLTKDDIVIFFQLYEIAPYSAGIPEFKIPYSVFKDELIIDNLK